MKVLSLFIQVGQFVSSFRFGCKSHLKGRSPGSSPGSAAPRWLLLWCRPNTTSRPTCDYTWPLQPDGRFLTSRRAKHHLTSTVSAKLLSESAKRCKLLMANHQLYLVCSACCLALSSDSTQTALWRSCSWWLPLRGRRWTFGSAGCRLPPCWPSPGTAKRQSRRKSRGSFQANENKRLTM